MSDSIRHLGHSRGTLYLEIEENLERIYELWRKEEGNLRFLVPVLCALKLEAFINAAGKLKVPDWNSQERKPFKEKCKAVSEAVSLEFDPNIEPNRTALAIFRTRNSLVHPKMRLKKFDEAISQPEYERKVRARDFGSEEHPLRSELTGERVAQLKDASDEFVLEWGPKFFDGNPRHWLMWGSAGEFSS
ncbi:MAG: hypothetical protein AAGC60_17695 [Acidobacteriota bacterium]